MDSITISAPGKLILFGEHAVVYGKMAIACSVGNRTFVRLTPTEKDTVTFLVPTLDMKKKWSTESLQNLLLEFTDTALDEKPTTGTLKKLKYFLNINSENLTKDERISLLFLLMLLGICKQSADKCVPAFEIQLVSYLPLSSGLGSSASASVCIAAALLQHRGIISSVSNEDSSQSWSKENLEKINHWAFIGECFNHGNPSGIDNTICTFGGVVAYENGEIESLEHLPMTGLIVNSKVERSTKKMVEKVKSLVTQFPNILNPVLDSIDAISKKAKEVLTSKMEMEAMFPILEELIDINHYQLCALGVGQPSLEQIRKVLCLFSLHGKLTGAGGGGCVFSLLHSSKWDEHSRRVIDELEDFGFEVLESTLGGPGVRICGSDDLMPF